MGLADDIRKQQQSNQDNDQLRQQWQRSGFTTTSPTVERPREELAALVSEALSMLSFGKRCYRAPAPDGTTRIADHLSVPARGLLKIMGTTYEDVRNTAVAVVPMSSQGKDCPNVNLAIFPDGMIAWMKDSYHSVYASDREQFGGISNVRHCLIEFLARQ